MNGTNETNSFQFLTMSDWSGLEALAEVSRNRTDRPDGIGTTGFEVLGEHQPACTSELILRGPCTIVNLCELWAEEPACIVSLLWE